MHSDNPKLSGPKRQHYLPRMYLKGFATNGGVAVFDRHTGISRRQSVENTAVERHIYTFLDESGRRRFEIEEMLSQVESGLANAIPRFQNASGFSGDDIDYLLSFIAFAELRTPSALVSAKNVYKGFLDTLGKVITQSESRTRQTLESMYKKNGIYRDKKDLDLEAKTIFSFIKNGEYEIDIENQTALMDCLRLWGPLMQSLTGKDLQIIRPTAEQSQYITCDAPVILETQSDQESIGFGSDDAVILFPLTPRCLIVLSGFKGRIGTGTAGPEQVQRTNEILARSADRYIIGGNLDEVSALCESLGLARTRCRPKYVTGTIMTKDGAVGFVRRKMPHRQQPLSFNEVGDIP